MGKNVKTLLQRTSPEYREMLVSQAAFIKSLEKDKRVAFELRGTRHEGFVFDVKPEYFIIAPVQEPENSLSQTIFYKVKDWADIKPL